MTTLTRGYLRAAHALAVAALLGGCATAAQRQAEAIRVNGQAATQQLQACEQAVYNDPAAQPIHRHIPIDVRDVTLEQLTDKSSATDDDISTLLSIHPRNVACRQAYLDQIGKTTPTFVPIIATFYARAEDSLIDLLQKKQSWGEHTRRVRDLSLDARSQLVAEGRHIDSGLARANQAELAQRQAAANAILQYMQTQQVINAMNRPVYTNCTGFGYSVNCVSH
jgi:hypothetical protein